MHAWASPSHSARPAAAVPGVAPGGLDPLGQRGNLAHDLRNARFPALGVSPYPVEAAAAEALPPRPELPRDGLQVLDARLLRVDRRRHGREIVLDPAVQVAGSRPVIGGGLLHGEHEAVIRLLSRRVAGDGDGHRPARRRGGLQCAARCVERVPVRDGDAGEAGRVALREAAHLPRRAQDVGEVDGIGLGVRDAGVAEPFGDGAHVRVDRGEARGLQRLAVGLEHLLPPLVRTQPGSAAAPGVRKQPSGGGGVRVDLALAAELEQGRIEGQAPAPLLALFGSRSQLCRFALETRALGLEIALALAVPRGSKVRLIGPAAKPGGLFFRRPRILRMAPRRRIGVFAGFEHLLLLETGAEIVRMAEVDLDLRNLPVLRLGGLRCRCPLGVCRARRRRQLPGLGREGMLTLPQRCGAPAQGGDEVGADPAERIPARLQVGMLRVDRLLQRPAPFPVVEDAAHRQRGPEKTVAPKRPCAVFLAGLGGRYGGLVPAPRRLDRGRCEFDLRAPACRLRFAGSRRVLFRSPGELSCKK